MNCYWFLLLSLKLLLFFSESEEISYAYVLVIIGGNVQKQLGKGELHYVSEGIVSAFPTIFFSSSGSFSSNNSVHKLILDRK